MLAAAPLTAGSGGLVLHAEAGARGEARLPPAAEAPEHRAIKGVSNIFDFKFKDLLKRRQK